MHRVVVADLNGRQLEEVPAKNLQYSFLLNRPGSVSFSMPIRHEKATKSLLDPGKREIYVYRGDNKFWGGYLWTAQPSGEDVRFTGEGYFSRLRRRYIDEDKLYSQVDQLDIAWDLIDFTQSKDGGDLGITRFEEDESSGVLRDRNYFGWEFKNIGEALEQLSAVENGFDFEITPDKEWKAYYPRKASSQAWRFELGGNIRGYSIDYDGSNVTTEITAIGEGLEADSILSTASDVNSRGEYGLLQDTRSFKDISVQATLDSHAEEELRLVKDAKIQPQIQVYTDEPPIGSYAVGDFADIIIRQGYVDIEGSFRITTITVQVSDEGNEAVGLFFGEVA